MSKKHSEVNEDQQFFLLGGIGFLIVALWAAWLTGLLDKLGELLGQLF